MPKLSQKAVLVLALLLSSSWNLQASISKIERSGNRSDAIMIPSPVINYARPSLRFGGGVLDDFHDSDYLAGPAEIWNPYKGFLVQINPMLYSQNFPTTGADGLYFDLLIDGYEGELIWEPVTHEGITATVTSVVADEWWMTTPADKGKVVARVKLTGPMANNSQKQSTDPGKITVPNLPQTFELVGRDSSGSEVVKYGFVLQKWFVSGGPNKLETLPNQVSWCSSLGYRLIKVKDVTNAVCFNFNSGPWCKGAVGATPSSNGNYYQRRIGAGFIAEWGVLSVYGAGFREGFHWTSDESDGHRYQLIVWPRFGDIGGYDYPASLYVICVTP